MRKFRMAGFTLVTVFALSVIVVASAFALEPELAEVLLNGVTAPAGTSALAEGTILLEVQELGIDILCSVIADGTINGAESLFLLEEVLDLSGEKVGDGLSGTALLCETDAGCEDTMDAEAWTNSKTGALPWDFEFELEESGDFVALLKNDAGYEVRCLVAGLNAIDECTAETGTTIEILNVTGGIESMGAATPDAECALGGKTGINEGQPGNLLSSSSGTLSLSTEEEVLLEEEFLLEEVLLNGTTATAGTEASLSGVVLEEVAGLGIDVLCSVIADGTIAGAESLFLLEEVLNLAGEKVGDGLSGTPLLCESDAGCENSMEAEAWSGTEAGALPWDFEFELEVSSGRALALLKSPAGYEIRCLVAGLSAAVECAAGTGTTVEVQNVTGGIEAVGASEPDAECALGGKTGVNEDQSGNLLSSGGGTLSLSTEAEALLEEGSKGLLAEILLDGAAAPVDTPAEIEGTILLETAELGTDVLCSFIADGLVDGAESLFEVEKILNLEDDEIGDGLSGTSLECEPDAGCEDTMEAEIWTNSRTGALPWDFEFELEEPSGDFVALLKDDAGYEFRCLVAGLSSADECTLEAGSTVENLNVTGGIEVMGAISPDAECSLGGKTGVNEGQPGNLLSSEDGDLELSSEDS